MSFKSCLTIIFLFFATIAQAQTQEDVTAYQDAATKFIALVTKASAAHDPAIISGPEGKPLVDMLSDDKRFLKSDAYSDLSIEPLVTMCMTTIRAGQALMAFDMKRDANKSASGLPPPPTALGNMQTFSGELSGMIPFMLMCPAKTARVLESAYKENRSSAHMSGVIQRRADLSVLLVSSMKILVANEGDEAMRMRVAQAIAKTASDLTLPVPLAERTKLRNQVVALMPTIPPQFALYIKSVPDAIDDTPCGALCQLGNPKAKQ